MVSINPNVGTLNTAGPGLITATLLAGQVIYRPNSPQPSGNFADTFDTAANLAAAFGANVNGFNGASFFCTYVNDTDHAATLTVPAGGNFTLINLVGAGGNIIPANDVAHLLISIAPGGAVTVSVLYYFAQA